jgi:hypothetical protein
MLIGMCNPVSQEPGHELYPHPDGCTGHRLWKMLQERLPHVSRRHYLETFERRNLVCGVAWNRALGRAEADRIYAELWGSRRTVVLLGEDVRRAFGHPRLLVEPQVIGGCTWRQLPHPSGRNLWYNSPNHRKMAGTLMEELYVAYHRDDDHVRADRDRSAAAGAAADRDQRRRRGAAARRAKDDGVEYE